MKFLKSKVIPFQPKNIKQLFSLFLGRFRKSNNYEKIPYKILQKKLISKLWGNVGQIYLFSNFKKY